MASMNYINDINKLNIEKPDYMLGKGLQMPFAASNSGSRKIMFGTQTEHRLPLIDPDVPFIQTGYENEFGRQSSSFVQIDQDLEVIGIVNKFSWIPNYHYYVFALDRDSDTIRVFERKSYKHITENYGYLFNNDKLDSLKVGDNVPKGTVIQKSMSFDEFNNRMDGKNLLTIYSSCEETMEDAIIISESASKKLTSPLVKKINIIINDNDIPLNLYGDIENYKIFPNIGEDIVNSILCGFRREKKEECLFSQSYARLRELTISDQRYTVAGKVVDVNIYANTPENLYNSMYNQQLKMYYEENMRVCKEIVDTLTPYIEAGCEMTYELQKIFSDSRDILNGKQYFSERVYSNIILEITVIEEIPVSRGDKLSNRYGGKGITAVVKPDCEMPRTLSGETVDIILNMCGVYGRENAGQLFELSVSYVNIRLLEYFRLHTMEPQEMISMYMDLLKVISPSMYDYFEDYYSRVSDDEMLEFISCMCEDPSMYLAIEPISENMTLDKVKEMYDSFSWIHLEPMLMPIKDSAGEIRYAYSRRPIVYGYQYIYRLKQYAEEKFSVTSLSATNIRNENSKSKSSNNYKALYSRTPIRFGDMETGNLIHLGASLVVQMLMLYSTSPSARRLTESMLTGDAFDIDVKLDDKSSNRNVEILNVYLKTMGLKLSFIRAPKKLAEVMTFHAMEFFDDEPECKDPMIFYDEAESKEVIRYLDEKCTAVNNLPPDIMEFPLMTFFDD